MCLFLVFLVACRTIHFPINQKVIITSPSGLFDLEVAGGGRVEEPVVAAGRRGAQRDTRTLSSGPSWVLDGDDDGEENYKGNSRASAGACGGTRANGKMKPNNKLQTICTFRGDSLVNDPRLKLQNAGRTHASLKLTTTDGNFYRRRRTGHVCCLKVDLELCGNKQERERRVLAQHGGGDGPATFPTLTGSRPCPSPLPFLCMWLLWLDDFFLFLILF